VDIACHKACPSPFKHLEEKCEAFEATKTCQADCRHDFLCRIACPWPLKAQGFGFKSTWQTVKSIGCQFMCSGDDEQCQKACGNPWARLDAECEKLQDVRACHKGCGLDRECHYRCPKFMPIWHQRIMKREGHMLPRHVLPQVQEPQADVIVV
jgi:hypothetical protein